MFGTLEAIQQVLAACGWQINTAFVERLSRSPHWVWAAIDPVTTLLLTVDAGARTLAMAQRVVHQVVQVLAPGCVPLFLTDGFKEYATALLTHYGQWGQPVRRQTTGPAPKPRWRPLPGLLSAQVVKTVRRRRLVRVSHRVVFGTLEAVKQVLAAYDWQIQTAFMERAVYLPPADKSHKLIRPTVTRAKRPSREGSHDLPAALSPLVTPSTLAV